MRTKPTIGVVGLAGEYEVGFDKALGLTGACCDALAVSGADYGGFDIYRTGIVMHNLESMEAAASSLKAADPDVLVVCVCTWSEDHHLLDLLALVDRPAILWAFPDIESGSMCGVHQICAVLTELGVPYGHIYGDPVDEQAAKKALGFAAAAALEKKMRSVRIGSVGGRIKGMTEIAFDEFEIKKRTGARIVNLDEAELLDEAEKITDEEAAAEFMAKSLDRFKRASGDQEMLAAMRHYLGMKALIGQYGLEGIVVKCYPRYMGKICLGYSLLSEEGIVCGCEGDANNTVMMKLLYEITGSPIHNTDVLYPDPGAGTLLFSHCGSGGFSIAATQEEILLGPVRLADSGVCSLFTAKPGVVTLANLVGRGGTMRMGVMVGEAVPTGMEFPGNPLKVRFDKNVLDINEEIARLGVGHHWMAGYGDVSAALEAFCAMKGIRYIRI